MWIRGQTMKDERLTREEWLKEWAKKGSKLAHEALTPKQRTARAKKAAEARWKKKK
jgi:hypothetical protein